MYMYKYVYCTWYKLPARHGSSFVRLVFNKGKATVLGLVSGTGVNDYIHNPLSHLFTNTNMHIITVELQPFQFSYPLHVIYVLYNNIYSSSIR